MGGWAGRGRTSEHAYLRRPHPMQGRGVAAVSLRRKLRLGFAPRIIDGCRTCLLPFEAELGGEGGGKVQKTAAMNRHLHILAILR